MNNQVIHFELRREDPDQASDSKDWYTDDFANAEGDPIGLCNAGLQQYVDLPEGCEQVDLILSTKDSDKRTFVIQEHDDDGHIYYNLDTEGELHFFGGISDLMAEMHAQGLIYLHFEYDA